MAVLDVRDQRRQAVELPAAAAEPARVGEEGGRGDACHGAIARSGDPDADTGRQARQAAGAAAAGAASGAGVEEGGGEAGLQDGGGGRAVVGRGGERGLLSEEGPRHTQDW